MLNHTLHPTRLATLAHQAPACAPAPGNTSTPLPSAALLKGHKTVAISHNGMLYTLQATKLGKLILTK